MRMQLGCTLTATEHNLSTSTHEPRTDIYDTHNLYAVTIIHVGHDLTSGKWSL